MKRTKHENFQLLLNLHKQLLEEQKKEYEKTYGVISNVNQYFQLVVSHDDFEWLRQVSAIMASFDEILESDNQDIEAVSKELIVLLSGEGDQDFYNHLQIFTKNNQIINQNISTLIESLKNSAL
jgi:hypothetical protein